ncbi:hypothetical protein J6590_035642 [Homalodisca vitripennis]|nr:hypothetical protein J6590_035642 [Homalodisca vitripennis]
MTLGHCLPVERRSMQIRPVKKVGELRLAGGQRSSSVDDGAPDECRPWGTSYRQIPISRLAAISPFLNGRSCARTDV